jgi:hypothetical protein
MTYLFRGNSGGHVLRHAIVSRYAYSGKTRMVTPKQIFVIGLLLLGPAFVMSMAGRSEWQQAKQLDAEPESVTLRQLADGDVSNRNLFLISDFRPAEFFYCESTEGSTALEECCVPLFSTDDAEDLGETIRVVAHVKSAANADQLYAPLQERPLLVQKREGGHGRTEHLAMLFPERQVENVVEVSVGDDIPSFRGATQWFLWAGFCVAGSLASFVYAFVFHLDAFGRRNANSSLTLDTRPVSSPKIKNSEAQLIGAHAEYFLARGFQSLGCVDCNMLGSTSRIALFLSPDGFSLLSFVVDKGHPNSTLMGIACDGSCFSIGRSRERVDIDGTAAGIPLIVNAFPEITDEQILRGFDVLKESLPGKGELAKIDPSSALALVHYRVLLKAWWALLHSASHLTPDPLPDRTEIFRSDRGVTTFCWGSNDTPSRSGGGAAPCDLLAAAGAR